MRFGFTYIHCNDLKAMKELYGRILGLRQIWEDESSLAYRIGDHQLTISLDAELDTPTAEFASQPGWKGGTAARTSWSLECKRSDFDRIVAAAQEPGIRTWSDEPRWVGYLSFPLLDPMNNTVEVTSPE